MTISLPTPDSIEELAQAFETKTPQEILSWAAAIYTPDIALTSSFQTDSMPLLHMVHQICPELHILFIDTGYHFWETLIFREMLERTWELHVVDLHPDKTWGVFRRRFRKELPAQDPNLCCYIHKVHPMQQAMKGLRAWISGIRRDQTPERASARILEMQRDGRIKINPLLNWTGEQVRDYINSHQLPVHPMLERGYRSIGCAPCTRPVATGEDERSGRWAGRGKRECGLHTALFNQEEPNPGEEREKFILRLSLQSSAEAAE